MQEKTSEPVPPRPELKDVGAIAVRIVVGAVVIFGFISLIGLLLTHVSYFATGAFHRADLQVDVWLADHRTRLWNDITRAGTDLASTDTVIAVAAVLALLLRWRLKRWYEAIVLGITVAGEVAIHLSVTIVVPERRPPVVRLDPAPPTSSYPSGHTAASVALYGCLAILVVWIYGRRPLARIVAGLLWCVPVFVGFSRMYRGEHYPSDVAAGALLAALWLTLVVRTLLPWHPDPDRRRPRGGSRGGGQPRPNGGGQPRPRGGGT